MEKPWIIFDMDGVITSEDGYWRAAECTLLALAARLGFPVELDEGLPWRLQPNLAVIAQAKALLINTNWDLCHLAAIALVGRLREAEPGSTAALRALDWHSDAPAGLAWPESVKPDLPKLISELLAHADGETGFSLLEKLAGLAGAPELLARKGPVWQWLFRHFQAWFNGRPGRQGILENERLLLDPSRIAAALERLRAAGWRLGIATGRTRAELIPTLRRFDLEPFFEADAVVTHDEVAAAEAELGGTVHLSKPHPFPFLRALYPEAPARVLVERRTAPSGTVVVGDTAADLAAAAALGALGIGVLTGPGAASASDGLQAAGAALLLADVCEVPEALAARPPVPNAWVAALPLPKKIAGLHDAEAGDLLLHLGEAWYPPAPEVIDALARLDKRTGRYPDSLSQELRQELAAYVGHGAGPENILIGNGSDGLIDLLVTTYAGPGRPVAAPAPTFFVYGHAAALRCAHFQKEGRLGQDAGFAFVPEYRPPPGGVLFLASPNNPTGDLVDRQIIERIASETRALVVVDECYFEFAEESAIGLLNRYANLVILRTLSKSFALAGLRAGYAVAHPDIIRTLQKADQTFSVNVAAQIAAVAALRSLPYYQPLFHETRALRDQWTAMLTAAGLRVFSSRANILLVEYPGTQKGPLATLLRDLKIHVADFHERPPVRSCFRVSVAEQPTLDRFREALNYLLAD